MQYLQLGHTGLDVSIVSLGTAPLGDMFGKAAHRDVEQIVARALEAGINFFDTSPYYGDGLAETRLGAALRGHRDEVLIGTKAGRYGTDQFDFTPRRIRASLEESLHRLRTDHVDIFQLHDIEFVELGPVLTDSYAELARLRDQGKCRFIGMTGYPTAALGRAIEQTDLDVVLSYGHSTLLDTCLQRTLLPLARRHSVGVINAAALALGLLTNAGPRIEHPAGDRIRTAARRIVEASDRLGVNVSFLANQFSIQRSRCATTVVGTVKPAHLDAATRSAETAIDEELLAEVLRAARLDRHQCWQSGLPENN